jgi:hypothetical protein
MNIYFFSKKKLIDFWQKSTNTGKSGATLIAHTKVTAFRFPETDQVYLTCNVEVNNIGNINIIKQEKKVFLL